MFLFVPLSTFAAGCIV